MTPRSIRRAQERKALKEARKAEQRQLSEAQLEANRANAQLSTGPKTAEGKFKISLNAVKTGLTGRTVLLPGDDVEGYNAAAAPSRCGVSPISFLTSKTKPSRMDPRRSLPAALPRIQQSEHPGNAPPAPP